MINCWLTAWSGAFCFSEGRICGDCSKYKFFRCDGRRGAFSFYRKICKLTPILISDKFDKYFTFMLLALCDGTTAQLQICSSERNVPLLPVDWEKYKGKNCFCKFCGLKNIRKELLPQILWIRTPNDKQNVMETFSDKMLGSIGKKLMSKVTHFLIFKV